MDKTLSLVVPLGAPGSAKPDVAALAGQDISDVRPARRRAEWSAQVLARMELLSRSASLDIDLGSRRVRASPGLLALLGGGDSGRDDRSSADFQREFGIGRLLRLVPAAERKPVLAQWRAARPGVPFEFRHRLLRRSGPHLLLRHWGVIEGERGIAILHDITAQTDATAAAQVGLARYPGEALAARGAYNGLAPVDQRQQRLLNQQLQRAKMEEDGAVGSRQILESLPAAVIGVDNAGMVVFVNRRARQLLVAAALPQPGQPADLLPAALRQLWQCRSFEPVRLLLPGGPCLVVCNEMRVGGLPQGHLLVITPDVPPRG